MPQFNSAAGLRPIVLISSDERHRSVIETVERPVADFRSFYRLPRVRDDGSPKHIPVSAKDIENAVTRGGAAGGERFMPEQGACPAALIDLNGRGLHAIVYRTNDNQYGIDLFKTEKNETRGLPDVSYISSSDVVAGYINRLIDNDPPDFRHSFSSPAGIPGRPLQVEAGPYSLPERCIPH